MHFSVLYNRQGLTFLRALGFLDFPMHIKGSLSVPDALAHAKTVVRSLFILCPGAVFSCIDASDFLGNILKFSPVSSALNI